jgi:hypothetical protein
MPRPKGPLPPEIAAKNRKNGKLGGAPTKGLTPELVAKLGEPPLDDDIALRRWYSRGLAILTYEQVKGTPGILRLVRDFRQNAGASGKLTPYDVIFAAQRKLRDDEEDLASDTAGEDEEIERPINGGHGVRADA